LLEDKSFINTQLNPAKSSRRYYKDSQKDRKYQKIDWAD